MLCKTWRGTGLAIVVLAASANGARADFDWTSRAGSEALILESGQTISVATIPRGVTNLTIELKAPCDLDLVLFDGAQMIAGYPDGLLRAAAASDAQYRDLVVSWSGWAGDGSGPGNEMLSIQGMIDRDLTLKAAAFGTCDGVVSYEYQSKLEPLPEPRVCTLSQCGPEERQFLELTAMSALWNRTDGYLVDGSRITVLKAENGVGDGSLAQNFTRYGYSPVFRHGPSSISALVSSPYDHANVTLGHLVSTYHTYGFSSVPQGFSPKGKAIYQYTTGDLRANILAVDMQAPPYLFRQSGKLPALPPEVGVVSISSALGSGEEVAVLRGLDYLADRGGALIVSAMQGSDYGQVATLSSTQYNGLVVGLNARVGFYAAGTNFENVAGNRSKPDIVTPSPTSLRGGATSWATPIVASAGVFLWDYARWNSEHGLSQHLVDIGLGTNTVVKAILMAGAGKTGVQPWGEGEHVWGNALPGRPLDPYVGAGVLNIDNSFRIAEAPRQRVGNCALTGWAHESLPMDGHHDYYFTIAEDGVGSVEFSVLLTWNRRVRARGATGYDFSLADLSLTLERGGAGGWTPVEVSDDAGNNVEHIYAPTGLEPGTYRLRVDYGGHFDSAGQSVTEAQPYALAWRNKGGVKGGPLKIVLFPTSSAHAGDFGGRSGADALCRAENVPACEGTRERHALLSINTQDELRDMPENYDLPSVGVPVVGDAGVRIADDWRAMFTSGLQVTLRQATSLRNDYYWSGSLAPGGNVYPENTPGSRYNCTNFTSKSGSATQGSGITTGLGARFAQGWLGGNAYPACQAQLPLMCACY